MAAPWEKYQTAPSTAPVPAFIPGTPKPVKPKEAPSGYRYEGDNLVPIPGGPADKNATPKDPPSGYMFDGAGGLKPIPGGPADKMANGPASQATEGERKSSGFLKRAINAENSYVKVGDIGPRSLVGDALFNIAPNVLNSLPAVVGNSPDRQKADQSQREFIAAILRYDLGAAIPGPEYISAAKIYYPAPGDSDSVIAQKAQARKVAIEGLRDASGIMASLTSEADGEVKKPSLTGGLPTSTDVELRINSSDGDQPYNRNRFLEQRGLDPNKEANMVAFWNANRGNDALSPAGALRFYAENNIPPPNDDDLNKMIEQAKAGLQFGPVDTSADEAAYRADLEKSAARQGEAGLTERADQGLLLGGSDEFAGLGGAIGSLLRGDNPVTGYQFSRDVQRLQNEKADANTGLLGDAVEIGAGLALPLGSANTIAKAAKTGALAGFTGGFGYGEGARGSALSAGVGLIAGTLLGAGGAKVGNALAIRAANKMDAATTRNALFAATDELGMSQPARMFTEPALQNRTRAVAGTITGGGAVQRGVQDFGNELEGAVATNLGLGGQSLERPTVGSTAQAAFKRTDKDMKTQTDRLYKSYQQASGDPAVVPTGAIAKLDEEIAALGRSPESNAGEIAFLQKYRNDMANGNMTVETLREMRTNLRGQINESGLSMSKAEGRIQGALDAAGDDIAKALDPKSKGYALLQRANKSHAERMVYKKQLQNDLMGKDKDLPTDPGKAFETILSWTNPKGDLRKLKALQRSFTPDEAADFAATVTNSISRDNNGNFSSAILLQNIEKLERAGKNTIETLFGPDGAKAVNNVKLVAAEHKRVNGAIAGQGSAQGNDWRWTLASMIAPAGVGLGTSGSGTALAAGVAGLVIKAGRDAFSAKMLLSPKVTAWVRSAPKSSDPKVIDAHFAKLGAIAKAEPALAADIDAFRSAIVQAANDNTNRAVAQDNQGEGGGQVTQPN